MSDISNAELADCLECSSHVVITEAGGVKLLSVQMADTTLRRVCAALRTTDVAQKFVASQNALPSFYYELATNDFLALEAALAKATGAVTSPALRANADETQV